MRFKCLSDSTATLLRKRLIYGLLSVSLYKLNTDMAEETS